jgi:hypothetical protein
MFRQYFILNLFLLFDLSVIVNDCTQMFIVFMISLNYCFKFCDTSLSPTSLVTASGYDKVGGAAG